MPTSPTPFDAMYLTLLDSLDAVIYVADMETYDILFLNRMARESSGGSIGATCWKTLQKDQEGPCPFCTNKYLLDDQGNPTEPYVWEAWNKQNGEWWECRDQAIHWPDGRLVRLEIATNITRRKQLEEESKKTITNFEESQKLAKIGNWELDLQTNELQWSDEIYRIFDLEQRDSTTTPTYENFLNAVHPEDKDWVSNSYNLSVKNKSPYDIVHRVLTKNQSVKYVREKCETFYAKDGTPLRSIGTIQDITALQLKELELYEEKQRLAFALQGANSGMWDWNLLTNAVKFDANYYTMVGYEPYEFPQDFEEWEKRIHPDDIENVKSTIQKTLGSHGDRFSAEFRFKRKDGNWTWIFAQGNIVEWNKAHNPVRFVGLHTDIDSLKKVETALRESEERLEMTLDGAELGSWDWYPQTGKAIFNERWAEMLGYKLDEIEPHVDTWSGLLHPDDRPHATKTLNDHVEGKTSVYQTEFRMKTKQGDWKWILDTGKVSQRDEDGRASRVTGTHQDISKRKRTEEQLKQSERRYRDFFENSLVGIFQTSPEGRYLAANQAFADMLGYETAAQLINEVTDIATQVFANPEERDALHKMVTDQGIATTCIYQLKRKDGTTLWANGNIRVVYDDQQKKSYYEGVGIDISEQKNAEIALRSNEENLRITLNSIGDAVIATDIHQKIVRMNPVAEKLTGWSEELARGKRLTDVFYIVNARTQEVVDNPVDKVLATGSVVALANHTILVSKNRREHQIADSAAPILDRNGAITGAVLVFRDVTEEYRIRNDLQRMQQLESIGTLAGGIAHDFNNILSGIFGNIALAMKRLEPEHPCNNFLEQAEISANRAKKLTGQLLTFAKGGEPIKDNVSLGELIQEVAAFDLSGSRVKLEFRQPQNIWSADVDRGQIQQVVSNLVINATQAMPKGGHLFVTLENFEQPEGSSTEIKGGKYIRIKIRDEGEGIPEKDLIKIFDPYFTTKNNGRGLGLTTVYSIIKRHEGHIHVQRHPDCGTTFTLLLPASERMPNLLPQDSDPGGIPIADLKILLMDDEETIRTLTAEMLKDLQIRTDIATRGEEALDLYVNARKDNTPYDVVILDLTIPGGMGGKETMEKLLEIDPGVKVIVSSGYADDPIMAQYQTFGFKSVIVKPYTCVDLRRALREAVSV